ncbi:hypothetical protein GCM10007216_11720 [Thalassobacillus devorans]|uniref:FAD/FMN-containing dehydrogenase n=1 Tax=Thalassobacillus devorans TaxID=279813 RepID=A0ABQ1NQD0_9BACI|nr:hypothetical protein [Thalassobacillus devorans]NIK28888.1 hypothetical protein [Thalassobacillus devorans]GGC82831.1 hypothetical protein GCM10007216_11720 [Thalassobacillus devorans]
MKRKLLAGIATAALVLGFGNIVLADGDEPLQGEGFWQGSFEEMLPFMKQMHPNFDDSQLEGMYQGCHGQNGPGNYNRGMMNNF